MSVASSAGCKELSSPVAAPVSATWRLAMVSLLLPGAAQVTFAEQLGVELLATGVASVSAAPAAPIDEIIVIGNRDSHNPLQSDPMLEDPLREEILEDFEMSLELEKATERQQVLTEAEFEPFSIRLGYDAYASSHEALQQQLELPMDLVRPATVISVGF